MKQVSLVGGPFSGSTADASRLDGAIGRLVMLWRLDNTPAADRAGLAARPNVKDWACLYHLNGQFDTTLEDDAARAFFDRGHNGRERWDRDHRRRATELARADGDA